MKTSPVINCLSLTLLLSLATACSGSGEKVNSADRSLGGGAMAESSYRGADPSPTLSPKAAPGKSDESSTVRRGKRSRKKSGGRHTPEDAFVGKRPSNTPQLTAGSWSDVDHFDIFTKFAKKLSQQSIGAGQSEAIRSIPTRQLTLKILGKDNQALENVEFRWKYKDGSIGRQTYVTKTDGSISLCSSWDRIPENGQVHAMIRAPGQMQHHLVPVKIEGRSSQLTIKCAALTGKGVKQLDLCLVIDCTGSMADELKYLQKEISDIARNVKDRYNNIKMRFSLVVYRDRGDQYVSKRFDFQEDIDKFRELLEDQSAKGGGDYPEAMDEALSDAAALSWNRNETARVCFLIADAPVHSTRESRVQFALSKLRSEGVVIYPIAASGVQSQAELIMRHAAFVTGGRYLFLTDDSGVGNPHAEPHIPEYDVELLKYLMTRMIVSELAGELIPARSVEILRSVRARPRVKQKKL